MRGKIARMEVANMRTQERLQQFTKDLSTTHPEDVNEMVQQLLDKLGPFDYGTVPAEYAHRQMRSMVMLENGSKYEGQWSDRGERDGIGVQIWPDGMSTAIFNF